MSSAPSPHSAGRSIRRSLLISLSVLSLIGMLLLFVGARQYGRRAADLSYDRLLNASASAIADGVNRIGGRWSIRIPHAAMKLLATASDDHAFYRVFLAGGATLAGRRDLPTLRLPPASGTLFFDAPYRGETVRFVVMHRAIDAGTHRNDTRRTGPNHDSVFIQVGQTRRARNAVAINIVWHVAGWIALFTVATLLLTWLVIDRALKPLSRIEHDFSRRTPFDLSPIQRAVPAELSHVVAAMNHFMSRLSTNIEALRAYIAEAAHQMRNPMAALRAQAQSALQADDPEQWRQGLIAIERNSSKLSRLLNQLLSHAHVTHRAELHHFKAVNLERIVRQALRESVPFAAPRPDVRFECLAADSEMRGDPLMLREAVKNLVDNGVKYGRADGASVRLVLEATEIGLRLTVQDNGPGIAPEERDAAFDRFVRGDRARPGGAGLGLAIVKRVAESHGGRVELGNGDDGGLVVRLFLSRYAV